MITITDRQTPPAALLQPATFNRAEDWREAANKMNHVTIITYYNPERTEQSQIEPSWALLAEEASKSWAKDNPF